MHFQIAQDLSMIKSTFRHSERRFRTTAPGTIKLKIESIPTLFALTQLFKFKQMDG